MNTNFILFKTNKGAAFSLTVIGVALFICAAVNAQTNKPEAKALIRPPLLRPDLVISSLSARLVGPNSVRYSWTITNVGNAPANLDGPTGANPDNVSVQAYLSNDTVFGNSGDIPAGGTILGVSPLGNLAPHVSKSGSFTSSFQGSINQFSYLVLKVDWGNAVAESNENNNAAAVGVAR